MQDYKTNLQIKGMGRERKLQETITKNKCYNVQMIMQGHYSRLTANWHTDQRKTEKYNLKNTASIVSY